MTKIDTMTLETISGELDTISHVLEFTCTSCAYCNSEKMLKAAIDSVRIAQAALAQKLEALDEEIAMIARCSE